MIIELGSLVLQWDHLLSRLSHSQGYSRARTRLAACLLKQAQPQHAMAVLAPVAVNAEVRSLINPNSNLDTAELTLAPSRRVEEGAYAVAQIVLVGSTHTELRLTLGNPVPRPHAGTRAAERRRRHGDGAG